MAKIMVSLSTWNEIKEQMDVLAKQIKEKNENQEEFTSVEKIYRAIQVEEDRL